MPAKPQAAADTQVMVDRVAHALVLTRTFAASRAQVFEAWTRPEHVASWWDPANLRLAKCEIDLRPGGAFKFVAQGSSDAPPFSGIYREIAPPKHIVFEALGAIGRVVLSEVGGQTQMTVRIECGSAAQLDEFVKMGVAVGTSQTLDNLVEYLSAPRAQSRT